MNRRIWIPILILLIVCCFSISAYAASGDPVLWLDKATYTGLGARPVITLQSEDLNVNSKIRDEVSCIVSSSKDPVGITIKLKETTPKSGEFAGDFGFTCSKSDGASSMLQVEANGTITVTYKNPKLQATSSDALSRSAKWQADTGTVKLSKSSYTGLCNTASATVTDKDLNVRANYIDTAKIKIYSDADPKGILLTAYETGSNTSTFTIGFKFDINKSDISDTIIKVNPSDNIYAAYIDEISADGLVNIGSTATSKFEFAEAVLETSERDDEGSGSVLTITINEPDANNPKIKDRILAKATSGDGTHEKTLWLDETGTNTGNFKCRLFLNDEMTTAKSLRVKSSDIISIKYVDNTIPQGGTKEIVKAVKWTYISTLLKTDKKAYTGYSGYAKITLTDYNLNADEEKAEIIVVRVETSDAKGFKMELKETSSNSGEFTGTLYFGKSAKPSAGVIKVVNSETITVTYTNPKDKDDIVECSAAWSFQDGQITLDKQEYKGNDAQVRITLRDLDAADDIKVKDDIRVVLRVQGSGKDTNIVLTETSKDSGTFTGTFYINGSGGNKPSINFRPNDRFEIIYTDKYTTSGKDEERVASAVWGGVSTATLTLDKQIYAGYGSQMFITLSDLDLNKSSTTRDKVSVSIRTKSGKTNSTYTLTETSNGSGVFNEDFTFTTDPAKSSTICVAPDDEITVTYAAKGVTATSKFTKQ